MEKIKFDKLKFYDVYISDSKYHYKAYKYKKTADKMSKSRPIGLNPSWVVSGHDLDLINPIALLNSETSLNNLTLEEAVLYFNAPLFLEFILKQETTKDFYSQMERFVFNIGFSALMEESEQIQSRFDKLSRIIAKAGRIQDEPTYRIKQSLKRVIGFSVKEISDLESLDATAFCFKDSITYFRDKRVYVVTCRERQKFKYMVTRTTNKQYKKTFGFDTFENLMMNLKKVLT